MPASGQYLCLMSTSVSQLVGPFVRAVDVTPSDSTVIPATRGLWVGTTGNVSVVLLDGTTVTLVAPALGVAHELRVVRVRSTGTTAGSIVALY